MTLQDVFGFLIFALVAAITPGPSNVMLTATGAAVGIWRGLPCLFGISLGMGTLILFVGLGLGRVLMHHPLVMEMMNWMGIGFLIWLSWKIASAPLLKSTDSKSTDPSSSESRSPVGFIGAALFQWINPKSWIVGTGAVSAYFRPHSEEVILYSFIFAFLFVIVAIPSNLIWLSFGAMIEHLFGNPVVARTFNIVMGILLTVSTVLLLL